MFKPVLLCLLACSAVPLCGIAQNTTPPPPLAATPPPAPPAIPPPAPSTPPVQLPRSAPKTNNGVFLGVDASRVPAALSDQLNLPEGFGLLVDYVVPGSAAEAAGIKKHDVLKILNDQILTSEQQLAVLVRSFSEGQEVTLVVLRKGQESKLTAKLQKRRSNSEEHPGERSRDRWGVRADDSDEGYRFDAGDYIDPDLNDRIRESIDRSRARTEAATARANEQIERAMRDVRERTARVSGSRLDLDDARILLRDSSGRIEIRSVHGKRTLTLRDSDGKKVFEGPIDTPEQRKAIPADALSQVEALEREQAISFPRSTGQNSDEKDD